MTSTPTTKTALWEPGGEMIYYQAEAAERANGPFRISDREIAYLYLDLGLSATECGRRLYVSPTVVLRRLAACGISRRPPGGSRARLDHRTLERAAFLYELLGLSLAAIARLEGIHPNAVRHRLRAARRPTAPAWRPEATPACRHLTRRACTPSSRPPPSLPAVATTPSCSTSTGC